MQEGREGGERLHRHTRSSDWSIHEQSLMEEEWQLSFVEITQTSHKAMNERPKRRTGNKETQLLTNENEFQGKHQRIWFEVKIKIKIRKGKEIIQ